MNAKNISIVSYITIIGWIIAYIKHKESEQKSALVSYHLGQGMGIFIFAIVLNIVLGILMKVVPSLSGFFPLVTIIPFILLIFGIIAANNEALKPVPLIGRFFEGKFNF